jgi:hypothetical protein
MLTHEHTTADGSTCRQRVGGLTADVASLADVVERLFADRVTGHGQP